MRDIYKILGEKEIALKRVRQEVEALRLACHLLSGEGASVPTSVSAGSEHEEKRKVINAAGERAAAIARIRAQLMDAQRQAVEQESGQTAAFEFVAQSASRTFLKRVLNSRLLEREFQRRTIRNLFERFRLSNAA